MVARTFKSVTTPQPTGVCRLCGWEIVRPDGKKSRASWHPECVEIYKLGWSSEVRRRARARDRGRCAACRGAGLPNRSKRWDADHIVPLWNGGGLTMRNVQTLCRPCHQDKTAVETKLRAELRRKLRGD